MTLKVTLAYACSFTQQLTISYAISVKPNQIQSRKTATLISFFTFDQHRQEPHSHHVPWDELQPDIHR